MGVSADKPETQLKFVEKFDLTFPVIPDRDKEIIDAYGAREVLGVTAKRRTFLIGPDGRILRIWPNVKVEGHAEEVLQAIKSMRAEMGPAG